ncbi:NAD-dependent epimerase/dehydratase family protein [Variovorax sp. RHLX14]|uniref:NAD-dependent epimerase/dehydratase family protein n=1 Tax=Variovorax sp. RHLX14 TaxID=1259731 RepID=UPI003F457AAA
MKTLIFGGAGFVGLNIAARLLSEGEAVVLFDRLPLPDAAVAAFDALPGSLEVIRGDVADMEAVTGALTYEIDNVVLGSAVTADAAREIREPETILQINLMALTPILRAARDAGVHRIVNLSSAAAYGRSALDVALIDETIAPQPTGLYGITKFASEMIGGRMADLWSLDFVSLRLSAVFGPWERATGVRDTTSPQFQITEAARLGKPALLARPGVRDWIYAPDVARAVHSVLRAEAMRHRVYNVSTPETWSVLEWGQQLVALRPGFECRLAHESETPTIDLHSPADRGALSVARLHDELGWRAGFGLADSVVHLDDWCRHHASSPRSSKGTP